MAVNKKHLSGIGRPIDLKVATNRAIAIITLLTLFGGFCFQFIIAQGSWLGSLSWGFQLSVSVFLTWALCREIDPDHNPPAFIASGIAFIVFIIWEMPSLLFILWILLACRFLNRIIGISTTVLDSIIFLLMSLWLTYQNSWLIGYLTGFVFLADAFMPYGKKFKLYFAGLSFLITTIFVLTINYEYPPSFDSKTGLLVLFLCLIFIPVILRSRQVESQCDFPDNPALPIRIQAAQVFALSSGVSMLLWHGQAGFLQTAPLWACVLASAVYAFYIALAQKN